MSNKNLPTPERIREDIRMAIADGKGLRGQTEVYKSNHQQTVDVYRSLSSVIVTEHRIPRHKLLGSIASKPFLSSIIDKGARTALWLPEPFIPIKVPHYAEIRAIVKTDDFDPLSAIRSMFDPSFYGFRRQPSADELLEEADGLLKSNGIDNMRERYQHETSIESLGLERTTEIDPASSNGAVTLARRRQSQFMDAVEGRISMSDYVQGVAEEVDRRISNLGSS